MNRVRNDQPGMAVNSRTGIPAAVGLKRIVDPHRDLIRPSGGSKMFCQIIGERGESIRPHTQRSAVYPRFAALVDAVELQHDKFVICSSERSRSGACATTRIENVPAGGGALCGMFALPH